MDDGLVCKQIAQFLDVSNLLENACHEFGRGIASFLRRHDALDHVL